MTIGNVLRKAKPLLWTGDRRTAHGQSVFICHAIERTDAPEEEKDMATALILRRLHPHGNLESWICVRLNLLGVSPKQIQQHRHAWLDQLIKEFE